MIKMIKDLFNKRRAASEAERAAEQHRKVEEYLQTFDQFANLQARLDQSQPKTLREELARVRASIVSGMQ
ncbi:hypothetical protein ACTXNP_22225 [Pseudomonas helleri]|uniref:hypothetical protein n=1 Tax=Pseudomonas helleri TaxID=1608996 RepID=UPI003FD5B8CF